MGVVVVPYDGSWPAQFERVSGELRAALVQVPLIAIEHVGSTAVPGLAAKPILDIDVIVERTAVAAAIAALETVGYVDRGDLGAADRESLTAPDNNPRRHVYVCVEGTLHLRNHLAVRDALRASERLRDEYAAVKVALARDPETDIDTYIAGKSAVLQKVLTATDLSDDERRTILALNT